MASPVVMVAIAVLCGVTMAVMGIRKIIPPLWLALIHGTVALSGYAIYAISARETAASQVPIATVVGLIVVALGNVGIILLYFTIAAVAGFFLFFYYHLPKKEMPFPLIVIHAAMATASLIALLIVL